MSVRRDRVSEETLFKYYIANGIISFDDIVGSDKETMMKMILEQVHRYSITVGKDGRCISYVPDITKPNGRRQVRKKNEDEMRHYLLEFYMLDGCEMTFADLFNKWLDYKRKFVGAVNKNKGLSPSTIRRFERDYDKYLSKCKFASAPIKTITPVILETEIVNLIKVNTMKERCANNLIGYIRQMFSYAKRSGLLQDSPSDMLDVRLLLSMCSYTEPKEDTDRVLTIEELHKLRDAVVAHEEKHPNYMPDYAIELAILTGMRVGEIAVLRWDSITDEYINVDFSEHRLDYKDKSCELVIGEPKNHKHRKIPMTAEIKLLLDRLKVLDTYDENGFIFARKDGSRYTGHDISCATARRASDAGIQKTSIHGIRRTVSSLLRTVLPVRAVANMLGHLETTNEMCYNYDISETKEKIIALSQVSSSVINFSPVA